MKIELKPIKLKDLFQGYKDDAEEGVVAYGGLLDVRPKYQREFVYKDEQRNAVVEYQRLLWGFHFFHFPHLPFFRIDVN